VIKQYHIVADWDGRKVSHLKRVSTPKGQPTGVIFWFDGDWYHPTKRSASANNDPFRLRGPTKYDEKVAKSWIKTLAKAGYKFSMVEIRQ
jgi:hypothetical protein